MNVCSLLLVLLSNCCRSERQLCVQRSAGSPSQCWYNYSSSRHSDTLWYNLWAVENAKYEDSTIRQKGKALTIGDLYKAYAFPAEFFIQNFDAWKDHYAEATKIFRRACQGEIDLWGTALNPGDL